MPIQNVTVDGQLTNLELVSVSKRLTDPYDEAYRWINSSGVRPHPDETVCTIVFASAGETMVKHLTWQEIVSIHDAYDRILEIEGKD